MADVTPISDPKVLAYWRDWLTVKDSAFLMGWTFAVYVYWRVQAEEPIVYSSTTANRAIAYATNAPDMRR